jgi:hypothetical protein
MTRLGSRYALTAVSIRIHTPNEPAPQLGTFAHRATSATRMGSRPYICSSWFPIRCQHPTRSASWPARVAAASASALRPPDIKTPP